MNLRSYIITKENRYIEDRFLNRGKITESNKVRVLTKMIPLDTMILIAKKLIDLRFKLFRKTLLLAQSRKSGPLAINQMLLEIVRLQKR
jgi:hypothetical protein